MQTSNVYRFFAAKSKINEAVSLDLLGRIEAEAKKIAQRDWIRRNDTCSTSGFASSKGEGEYAPQARFIPMWFGLEPIAGSVPEAPWKYDWN
jgi:hypothetical protein